MIPNLDELEKLANAATPRSQTIAANLLTSEAEVQFYLAARTAVPELIREMRRLRETLEYFADDNNNMFHCMCGVSTTCISHGERARKALEGK